MRRKILKYPEAGWDNGIETPQHDGVLFKYTQTKTGWDWRLERWSEMHSNCEWALAVGWKVFASHKTNTWSLGAGSVVSHLIIQHRHSLLCQDWVRQRRQNLRQRINWAWIKITDMFKTEQLHQSKFLLLAHFHQSVDLLNIQRTFIVIIVFFTATTRIKHRKINQR